MLTKMNGNVLPKGILVLTLLVNSVVFFSCESHAQEGKEEHSHEVKGHDNDPKNHKEGVHDGDEEGHHGHHGHEHGEHGHDEGHEEHGGKLGLNDTYDETEHGVHLVLNYDKASSSFVGTIENTTEKSIEDVRVEVHLSNGTEVGPTSRVTLAGKAKQDVSLKVSDTAFTNWSTHAEVGNDEHGKHGEEHGHEEHGGNEHGHEHGGEHR